MALPLWSQLQKSQDDDETIEEAIARLIAVHNSSGTAHLGTGESLRAHKEQATVDHPIGSVLTDKYSMTELELVFNSRISGGSSLINRGFPTAQNGFNLQTYDGDLDVYYSNCSFRMLVPDSQDVLDFDFDMLVEGLFHMTAAFDSGSFYFGLLDWDFASTFDPDIGIGFEFVDGDFRGFLGLGATRYTTDVLSISPTSIAFYRVVWNASTKIASYFINGDLVATISAPTFSGGDGSVRPVFLALGNGVDDEIEGDLSNFYFSRSLVSP